MRVRKEDNFSPFFLESFPHFRWLADSRDGAGETGEAWGWWRAVSAAASVSFRPSGAALEQALHSGASRKEVGFFVAESDEEMESTSVFFQMKQFTFLSLRQLVYSSTLATMKKSYTDASPESGFQNRPSASSEIRCRISTVWCNWSEGVLVVVKILHSLQRFQKFKCQRNLL